MIPIKMLLISLTVIILRATTLVITITTRKRAKNSAKLPASQMKRRRFILPKIVVF